MPACQIVKQLVDNDQFLLSGDMVAGLDFDQIGAVLKHAHGQYHIGGAVRHRCVRPYPAGHVGQEHSGIKAGWQIENYLDDICGRVGGATNS